MGVDTVDGVLYVSKPGGIVETSDRSTTVGFRFESSEFSTFQTVQGKQLYYFHKKSRLLELSISPGGIERLMGKIGPIPQEGMDLEVPISGEGYIEYLQGVKNIVSLPSKNEDYILDVAIDQRLLINHNKK